MYQSYGSAIEMIIHRVRPHRCAMALVHSRIGRVFYACRDPGMGALGSVFTLNTEPVNHKFEVCVLYRLFGWN